MNRNVESHFSLAPNVNIPRSICDRSFDHKTTFNVGRLIPIYYSEVLPGQSTKMSLHSVVRLQPMITCPIDDLYLDTYFFFVPNRLVWNHWKEFMGENTNAPWVSETEYTIPQLIGYSASTDGIHVRPNTILDYFGIPNNSIARGDKLSFSALPFRAYGLIVREFFQDQNLETPVNVPLDDTDVQSHGFSNWNNTDSTYVNHVATGGDPYIVNRYHDYFSSATPGPTKSLSDILAFPDMPVIPGNMSVDDFEDALHSRFPDSLSPNLGAYYKSNPATDEHYSEGFYKGIATNTGGTTLSNSSFVIPNLMAVSGVTINDLRNAFAVQRLLERDLFGTRYREMLKAHFGVTSPDASMQVPQYLGGKRSSLKISQILQTSETGNTPQGTVTGYSLTSDSDFMFEQSFTEHGQLIGLACVRYKNSYQNGLNKMFSRKTRFDYYFPELCALGNMPILKKELFADGSSNDDDVFGYQEAWAEYRYHPDMITGELRSNLDNSLDSWHFGDDYDSAPSLSRAWMKVSADNVDRVLAVQSSVSNQLLADFLFDEQSTLPMPLYSVPGLNGYF